MKFIDKIFSSHKKSMSGIEYIIAGLGNPGSKYENTRHNVGFMAIDKMCEKESVNLNMHKFESICGEGIVSDKRVLFLKPQTFMNESGRALKEAALFYKIPINNIIVVFDDISLEPGKIRIKRNGSHGGHNGIKSIINYCKSENFPRVKIGVGNKPNPNWDLADWVLSRFSRDDMDKVNASIESAVNGLEIILDNNIDLAMNKFN